MAEAAGTVTCVLIQAGDTAVGTEDACLFEIKTSSGALEAFTVWFGPLGSFSAADQLLYSMWVELLRQSLVSHLPVTVVFADSGQIGYIQLNAA